VPSDVALAYLRLLMVRGIGPRTGRQLITGCGSIERLWQLSAGELGNIEGAGPKLVSALNASTSEHAEKTLARCLDSGIRIISLEDDAYPAALRACDDAPLLLFALGDVEALQSPRMLSVVGARKASRESKLIARRWSAYCSKRGVTVVSGMAYGIDAAAHGGALEGDSPTVAVLGCGLDQLNDVQRPQVEAIMEQGCVISEYLPEVSARAENFPQRNRIIAGLSQATLVVEASLRSGSMITAGQALTYGREVLAVPGSVLNDGHEGCHRLIRDGAMIVTSGEELLQHLGWSQQGEKVVPAYEPANDDEEKIITALTHEILHLDMLAEACNLTVSQLSPSLLALELQGVIQRLPGSRYSLGGKN